jgi:alpha-L-fucosidase
MDRRQFSKTASSAMAALAVASKAWPAMGQQNEVRLGAGSESMAKGRFEPNWESLRQYSCPDWFRDAKFGIWQHWSAQCVPEQGDWYARNMYQQFQKSNDGSMKASHDYDYQCQHYGHPSRVGFKDIDHLWHAENWDPQRLVSLYKLAGARYVVALANHHDNFDNWNSKYQPWNSVAIGPKKDLIGGWAKAVRSNGLKFGVSVHGARAWDWFDVSRGSDSEGPLTGVSYDGVLTKADGKGLWWDGLDPQDLYAQNHPKKARKDAAYCTKFYNRTMDLINQHSPDVLCFDDDYTRAGLPLYDVAPEVGLQLAAHFYNANEKLHGGKLEAVLNGKRLSPDHVAAMVEDIEQGSSTSVEPLPWQTETCIGNWHYNRTLFEHHSYAKSAKVLRMLVDIVSKNGNLLLSIPVRGDGTIDADEEQILTEIAAWMDINGEAIFATRPWSVFGEGPSLIGYKPEMMRSMTYTAEDVRFTTKGKTLYAFVMDWPKNGEAVIKTLAEGSTSYPGKIGAVTLLGSTAVLKVSRTTEALRVTLPSMPPCSGAFALRIERV